MSSMSLDLSGTANGSPSAQWLDLKIMESWLPTWEVNGCDVSSDFQLKKRAFR